MIRRTFRLQTPEEELRASILVLYRNHRGEVSLRRITPYHLFHGRTEHHPEEQWLLDCYDHHRRARRTYALKDCNFRTWETLD